MYYNRKLVWKGGREPQKILWILPIQECNATSTETKTENTKHMAYNAYYMTSKEPLIKYIHQAAFSPPKQTLLKAISNKQFSTWPGFTAREVKKYLPESAPAIDKGHTRRQNQGIRITKEKTKTALYILDTNRDLHPPITTDKENKLFAYYANLNPKMERYMLTSPKTFQLNQYTETQQSL